MEEQYVISIKRIKDYCGNVLPDNEQFWAYAQYDDHSGSFSTGYPCFSFESHAKTFPSIEAAEKWWDKNKKDLFSVDRECRYDLSTLAVRKRIYKSSKKLSTNI